jgi:polyhydroxyalkanoate synthesis repressor PhaR
MAQSRRVVKSDASAAAKASKASHKPAPVSADGPAHASAAPGPRILKKYPNRRLYDTQLSSYITLADVKAMVLSAGSFEVRDAKTGEDLTRSILLQIILEEESGGVPIFSAPMLSQIIRFYGHSMQGMMGSYLEKNLQTFTDIQARLSEQSKGLLDPTTQTPEMWSQFLKGQAPGVQGLMGNYMEQSRKMFAQMQEQMAKQAGALFPGMPGFVPPKR